MAFHAPYVPRESQMCTSVVNRTEKLKFCFQDLSVSVTWIKNVFCQKTLSFLMVHSRHSHFPAVIPEMHLMGEQTASLKVQNICILEKK